jgi:hypothetical protein
MAFGLTLGGAILAGSAIAGGTALIGGAMASSAAGDAADAQADAANNASANSLVASRESNALQKEMFDKQIELNAPFRNAGLTGQNRLMEMLGLSGDKTAQGYGSASKNFSMSDFQEDPGYQFRLQQGQQALERSASARSGLLSGRAAKDMTSYAQGTASQEYGNAFNRFQTNRSNQLGPLQSLAGVAQTASGAMSGAAGTYGANVGNNLTSTANTVGNNMMGAGNARASGYVGSANAINGALSGGVNAFQQYNMMNKMFPSAPAVTDGGYSMGTGSAYGGLRAGL